MQNKIRIKFGNWVINLKSTKKIGLALIKTKHSQNRNEKSYLENEGIKRYELWIKSKIEDSQIKSLIFERIE